MQERCNSIAKALELHLSCTNPSRYLRWYDNDHSCFWLPYTVHICHPLSYCCNILLYMTITQYFEPTLLSITVIWYFAQMLSDNMLDCHPILCTYVATYKSYRCRSNMAYVVQQNVLTTFLMLYISYLNLNHKCRFIYKFDEDMNLEGLPKSLQVHHIMLFQKFLWQVILCQRPTHCNCGLAECIVLAFGNLIGFHGISLASQWHVFLECSPMSAMTVFEDYQPCLDFSWYQTAN